MPASLDLSTRRPYRPIQILSLDPSQRGIQDKRGGEGRYLAFFGMAEDGHYEGIVCGSEVLGVHGLCGWWRSGVVMLEEGGIRSHKKRDKLVR